MLAIKKNDQIVVIAGKDKGKTGKVLKIFRKQNRILVEHINMAKKSQRRTQENQQGGFIEIEMPIHRSNIMLIDKKTNKPTRFGISILKDGTKVRISKKVVRLFSVIVNLQKKYKEEVVPKVQEKFNIRNSMAVPILEKIVVNMGVGEAISDMKIFDSAVADLTAITGQKPSIRKAKKAISNFKLREGLPIGCKVTLRRTKMFEFLDRLLNTTLPRIRDFNGVSRKSFDRQGNYSIGIEEQAIFPEIDSGRISHVQGMDITFVFNKGPKEQTFEVLSLLGMPFRKKSA